LISGIISIDYIKDGSDNSEFAILYDLIIITSLIICASVSH